ncbi:phosphoribosyltransferase [Halobacteriovorax sp.]|uniref:phosphoribosyltransferase n=1 Tax=Halobacteriovorax sp. TaxID=2020862 RepID=UPI003AF23134
MFKNRKEAGQLLSEEFKEKLLEFKNVAIIALPRGGVPIAFEIAKMHKLPLDIFCVKKVGAPNNEELALGAVTEESIGYLNQRIINHLNIDDLQLHRLTKQKKEEVKKQAQEFRNSRPPIDLSGRSIFIVDDGIATGATMKAAIKFLKKDHNIKNIFAVAPVSSRQSYNEIIDLVDDILVLETPHNFLSVGEFYLEFPQVSNKEVCEYLETSNELRRQKEKKDSIRRFENEGGAIYESQDFTINKKHYHSK